jgi:putative ABC transport system permease protein
MYHPHRIVEVDEGGAAPLNPQWPNGYRISAATVAPGFFEAVSAPILAGRGFSASDHAIDMGEPGTLEARGGPVVVNQSFVRLVLGGRNPIGRRVRYVELEEWEGPAAEGRKPAAWYEIIGVVRDVGMAVGADVGQESGGDPKVAGMYHVIAPGAVYPAHVGIHVAGDPTAFGPRLRAIATDIDPTLRLYKVIPLSDVTESELQFLNFWFRLILGVSAIALALSLAGIYSVMSFTVARRTREIGVRVALGASAKRVALAIFRRPLTQVSLGVLGGAAIVAFFARAILGVPNAKEIAFMFGYVMLMLAICLLACIVPTRRALRIQPTEALRAED